MLSRKSKRLSELKNDLTMDSIVDYTINQAVVNETNNSDHSDEVPDKSRESPLKEDQQHLKEKEIENKGMKRTISDATEEFLDARRKREEKKKQIAKLKIRLGYVVAGLVLTILWVGYITTAIFLLYGFITNEVTTQDYAFNHDKAFNQTYQNKTEKCPIPALAFNKYSIFINALENSSYEFSPINATNSVCPIDFVNNKTHCTAECLRFTPGGRPMWYAFRLTTVFGSSLTIFAASIGMFAWLLNRELWKFPKVVNFYMMITVLLQGFAILSGAIKPEDFYCTSPNIDKSRETSTYFCLVQGAIMHYALLSFLFWYIFGISNLAIIVLSPIKGARWFFNNKSKIHIVESIIAWGFPVLIVFIAVIISVADQKARSAYRIENVPEFCLAGETEIQIASKHVLGFIFCLFNGTMITIIVFKLVQLKYKQKTLTRYTTVNTEWVFQLSIFTFVFSLSIWIVLLDSSIYIFYETIYTNLLRAYTQCVSLFPNECCQPTYQKFYFPWLSTLSGLSTCIWGIGGLTAVANKEIRQFWKRAFMKICKCGRK